MNLSILFWGKVLIDAAIKANMFANICNKKKPSMLEFGSNAYKK